MVPNGLRSPFMARTLIIVDGSEDAHDLWLAGQSIQRTLTHAYLPAPLVYGMARFELNWYQVQYAQTLVLYLVGAAMSETDLAILERRVEEGMGLVVLHASNVVGGSITDEGRFGRFFEMIGSRFTTHEEFGRFEVEVTQDHPVTQGITSFSTDDEPYEFSWAGVPGEVLAVRKKASGETVPVVYVKEVGKGRVCYIALGHDQRGLGCAGFRRMLVQATMWTGHATRDTIRTYRASIWPPEDLDL